MAYIAFVFDFEDYGVQARLNCTHTITQTTSKKIVSTKSQEYSRDNTSSQEPIHPLVNGSLSALLAPLVEGRIVIYFNGSSDEREVHAALKVREGRFVFWLSGV